MSLFESRTERDCQLVAGWRILSTQLVLPTSDWGKRQIPPLHHGKATGDSFSADWNSKTRIAEQLREEAGPCPDPLFLVLEGRRTPDHTCAEKAL